MGNGPCVIFVRFEVVRCGHNVGIGHGWGTHAVELTQDVGDHGRGPNEGPRMVGMKRHGGDENDEGATDTSGVEPL